MELSPVTIPSEKLKIWKIFRDVGFEGEEILKVAKLAHVANEKEAFVVTSSDETYTFLREDDGGCKITKIPELCHVQVEGKKLQKIGTFLIIYSLWEFILYFWSTNL